MNNPKVSIITVCYNASSLLENTILSVINQTYENIEYIIIDGCSKDGTVDVIEQYSDKISYWVSEPDNGIYDAMNKGILKATGEWLNFMNAGDSFASHDVLKQIFVDNQSCLLGKNAIYGDSIFCTSVGERYGKCLKTFWNDGSYIPGKGFSHQSSFIKADYAKLNLFDTSYKICADYKMFYDLFQSKDKTTFVYMPFAIAKYEVESGCSKQYEVIAYAENARITGKEQTFIFKILKWKFFLRKTTRNYMSVFCKKYIPSLFKYIKNRNL